MSRPRVIHFDSLFERDPQLVPPPRPKEQAPRFEHICETCGSSRAWLGQQQHDRSIRWYCSEHAPELEVRP